MQLWRLYLHLHLIFTKKQSILVMNKKCALRWTGQHMKIVLLLQLLNVMMVLSEPERNLYQRQSLLAIHAVAWNQKRKLSNVNILFAKQFRNINLL